ncbi:hypothetical protein [Pantoea anthophila]|uniref:hypothetical protein n=1 Tax=Pantoea anthophila TaxID=470931 RepID=UPI003AFAF7D5
MHRIDTSTAQKDKFGAGKNGFTGGNPQTGELPTALDADYFDSLQEEISSVIEAAGLTLSKAANSQLKDAIARLTLSRKSPFSDIKSDGSAALSTARSNLGLGSQALQSSDAVNISGGNATLSNLTVTTFNGKTVNPEALNVSNTATFAGAVAFTGQDYLNKSSVVNVPGDNSNQTFGLRLSGSAGQRSDELFYEKIGTFAARRFIVISGGNTTTFDMRQDGSMVSLNPVGTWQVLPSGDLYGPKWGGNLSDFISSWSRSNFMTDTRLGSVTTLYKANNTNVFTCPSGYSFSSIDTGDVGTVTATARPIQKQINGNWITVSQL